LSCLQPKPHVSSQNNLLISSSSQSNASSSSTPFRASSLSLSSSSFSSSSSSLCSSLSSLNSFSEVSSLSLLSSSNTSLVKRPNFQITYSQTSHNKNNKIQGMDKNTQPIVKKQRLNQ